MYRFLIFILIGVTNSILGLLMMVGLVAAGFNPYAANLVAYTVGFFFSFYLHDNLTFNDAPKINKWRIVTYCFVYLTSFVANYCMLFLLLEAMVDSKVSFVLSSATFAVVSFLLNKSIVYKVRVSQDA